MELHPFQLTLVDEIISKEIYNVQSFFDKHCIAISPENEVASIGAYPVKCEPTECIDRIVKFVSLCKKLEREGLIHTATDSSQTSLFPFFPSNIPNQSQPPSPDFILNEITRDYVQKAFFPDAELKAFKEREYKTSNEFFAENEEKHRGKSYRLAFRTAIASIVLSFLTLLASVFTTLFVHRNSTNERIVMIKNGEVISDTVKVLLLSHEAIDTTPVGQIHKSDSAQASKMFDQQAPVDSIFHN